MSEDSVKYEANSNFIPRIDLEELQSSISKIRDEVKKIIVGQDEMINLLICALLADGHILIEGVPGVAKTLTARLFAKSLDMDFSRIQFTPDLMPSDITGTSIYNANTSDFEFKKGPVFSNLVLIDEINRAPAKTQAALFEVMQEKQITNDGTTYAMSAPFVVVATQNPIEHEGTYKLPEAQLDRFLFKIDVGYPSPESELEILEGSLSREHKSEPDILNPVVSGDQVNKYRQLVAKVHIEKAILEYITKIMHETRNSGSIYIGASPRASVFLVRAAQSWAAMHERDFVIPEDVREVLAATLRHRIILTPEKEMEGVTPDQVLAEIANMIEVPR